MRFWCSQAWIHGRWQSQALLQCDDQGLWSHIDTGVPADQAGDAVQLGPVLPGLVNAHSHAFQRAMVGVGDRIDPSAPADDFWSWRERMYRVAHSVGPEELETIATWLYAELLACGFTQVCEFHYIHRDPAGQVYRDPHDLSWALVRAAERTGMGLTLLPTLYMRQGFGQTDLLPAQCRFASDPQFVMDSRQAIRRHASQCGRSALLQAGVALHSLRAVPANAVREIAQAANDGPIHIHVAEQPLEVAQCQQHLGSRPVQWLIDQVGIGPAWHLVHATHIEAAELEALARSGAQVVLCPSTEADLGDGLWPLARALELAVPWSLGTDSHVGRHWADELRLLEYGQRLHRQARNIAARHAQHPSSAAALFEVALHAGSRASGLPLAGIAVGQRADLQELEVDHPTLAGLPVASLLDASLFSSPAVRPRRVWVAGRCVHTDWEGLAAGWRDLLGRLWPGERAAGSASSATS